MSNENKSDDGVQRDKLDYRAGYVEGLQAAIQAIQVSGLRATKKEVAGLEKALALCQELRRQTIEKMRSK